MSNELMNEAKSRKNDEFYTSYEDIEKEMKYYAHFFKDKTVYCNCDDHYSNFRKYFFDNFDKLGLKRLICTSYPHGTLEDINKDEMQLTVMKGDGDFRSEECIEFLKQCDIVVTNPPFSLLREFVAQLVEYKKKFLIIGTLNAVKYKEIFPLLQSNRLWLGWNNGDMAFKVPSYFKPRATRYWEDETGQKWRSLGNICWFTNLDHAKRHEELICYKQYTPEEYPTYLNYNAIEVSKLNLIPVDYEGEMGVPITFFQKYNPDQFEVIGDDYTVSLHSVPEGYVYKGKELAKSQTKVFWLDEDGKPKAPYHRIIIKHKR